MQDLKTEQDYLKVFHNILENFNAGNKWINKPFEKMVMIPLTNRGQLVQLFIERICSKLSLPIELPKSISGDRATQSPWDLKINGVTFEIKAATEDTNNKFQFNHIRYHRKYDALLCVGISPGELRFRCWTAADVKTNKAGNLVSMEKAANASFKLTKSARELLGFELFKIEIDKIVNSLK